MFLYVSSLDWGHHVVPNLNSFLKMGYENQPLKCCLHKGWRLNVCNKWGICLPHLTLCIMTWNVQNHFELWLAHKSLQKRLVPACQWKQHCQRKDIISLGSEGGAVVPPEPWLGLWEMCCELVSPCLGRSCLFTWMRCPCAHHCLCAHHCPSQWWMCCCCDNKHGRCRKGVTVSNVCTVLTQFGVGVMEATIRRKSLPSVVVSVGSYQESRLQQALDYCLKTSVSKNCFSRTVSKVREILRYEWLVTKIHFTKSSIMYKKWWKYLPISNTGI